MKTIFLKFKDETEAMSALFSEDETSIWPNTDIIGTIYISVNEDIFEPLDGYHVNLAAESCPEGLRQYEVFPTTPSRVFGGLE